MFDWAARGSKLSLESAERRPLHHRAGGRPGLQLCALSMVAALAISAGPAPSAQARPAPSHHIIYLHGAIVERLGPTGWDPRHGAYDLPGIVSALSAERSNVIADRRAKDTDPSIYADRVVHDVMAMLESGVPASEITIIGASKGAVIAALVSSRLKVADLRYVLMGNCNAWLIRTFDPRLTGRVLSIYDQADEIGGSCADLAARSPRLSSFSEVRLETGLGHGFLYRPMPVWVKPALAWAKR